MTFDKRLGKTIYLLIPFLALLGCGNNSPVSAYTDPSGSESALILPEGQEYKSNSTLFDLNLFDLKILYDEINITKIDYLQRSLLYVNDDGSVMNESLLWDSSVSMWSSFNAKTSQAYGKSYKLWKKGKWERIDQNSSQHLRYNSDGTVTRYLQSQSDPNVEMELATLSLEQIEDLSGRYYKFEELNVTMSQGALKYTLNSGLKAVKMFAGEDGDDREILDGPRLEIWDLASNDLKQIGFPTLSSFLYAASQYDTDLGTYFIETETPFGKEIIKGAYYPTLYETSSAFGTVAMEGTKYSYDLEGGLIKASSIVIDGASWAIGVLEGLTVLELVDIDGQLRYFAIIGDSVKYLSVEMPGIKKSVDYINEIAVESIVETLQTQGRLAKLKDPSTF